MGNVGCKVGYSMLQCDRMSVSMGMLCYHVISKNVVIIGG